MGFAIRSLSAYDYSDDETGGVLPTQPPQESQGDGDAGSPGLPSLRDVAELNRAIHDEAGQPERFALDQRSPLQGVLDELSQRPSATTSEDIVRVAGRLAHGVASAQSFRDGNRRTAFWLTYPFLRENGLGYLMVDDDHTVARYLISSSRTKVVAVRCASRLSVS
ncbi:MAG: Fic family protein [Patulibacter sp.]|nr:Fic family protein [Patulibacter sp.]